VEKQIKIIILSSGNSLISEIEEFDPVQLGDPDWKLVNPYQIFDGEIDKPWLSQETDQNQFKIISDMVFSVAEPKKSLLEKYLEKTN